MDEPHYLFWRNLRIGVVTEVGWTDFPWAGGKIILDPLNPQLRSVLEFIEQESKSENGLQDWPFEDEFAENWRVVKPDQTSVEIMPPVIDFAEGFVTWR